MSIKGKQIEPQYVPTNYVPTSPNLDGNLEGIDNALVGAGNIFGTEYDVQEQNTPASTTSTTYQTFDTYTIPADTLDPAGLYRIAVGWVVTATAANTEVKSRLTVNGVADKELVFEPNVPNALVPIYIFDTFSGIINVGVNIVIALQYARNAGTGSAGIEQSAFELWRVQ